jgi:opacity protein-like surface antigen
VSIDNGFYTKISSGFDYGAGIEYFIQKTNSVELRWLGMGTKLPLYGPTGNQLNKNNDDGSTNYILVGGTGYFGNGAKAVGYGGAGIGVGIVSLKDGGSSTKFAWDAKLGVKLKTSSTMSVNLQAYVKSISAAVGSDLYLSWWGPVAVADYATIFQFGLGGVLCFNFKKK